MDAKRFIDIKKAQERCRDDIEIETYVVSSDCKQKRDFDSICLGCGACGRVFTITGKL